MAKIYVSSTFLDLQEFREKILYHLQRLQQSVVAMEYYLADDRRPAEKCIADVEACDIYVGIFAWRYGTIPEENNPEQLSITEMEYRAARDKGIPCLIFLQDDNAPWPPRLVDDDKTRIKALRQRLEKAHTPQWFKNTDELASLVGASLYDLLIEQGQRAPQGITPLALDRYYAALRQRYNVLALEGLTPPQKEEYLQIQLRQVFVEQNVRENPPPVELPKEVWQKLARDREIHLDDLPSDITLDEVRRARETYYERPSRPVLDVLTDSRYPRTIILGDPGSGKSTLARYVMLSLIDPATADNKLEAFAGYLPLLVELRSYAGLCAEGNCTTFLEFLEYLGKTEGWALTQSALHNHLKNDGRAVVIFDGLDEIFDPEMRERVTRQIVGFGNDYPKARVIVTSRVIGYRRKILTDAGFTHFMLQDLDEKQVETFVSRWYDLAMSDRPDEAKERRERILRSFKESASIRQLAGNPMLLTIMAIIGKHQELPRERWKLYDHAASVLIQHWDVNKHLKDARIDADFIGEDDKKELLRRLAFRMQGGDAGLAGNYIHREQLQAEFEGYLRERYAQTPDRAVTIARAMIDQFRERNFILSLYGANLYGFVHRAFLEYFCASAFAYKFEKAKELTIDQLKTDVYGKHWEDQNWHEVLRLICGMIEEKWAKELINFLATSVYLGTSQGWIADFPWKSILLIQCLGELRNPSVVAEHYSRLPELADNLMQQIDSNETSAQYGGEYDFASEWSSCRNELKKSLSLRPFLTILVNDSKILRSWAVDSLAENFHDDPQTLQLLRDHAVEDDNGSVRQEVVAALIKHYRDDPQTLLLLRDRAVKDDNWNVRQVAVAALIKHYRDDPQTLLLLRDRAVKDDNWNVRQVAVAALIEHYRDDPQTLLLLRDRAVKDDNWNVRQVAVAALIEHYRDDPQTLLLLRDRAVKDDNWNVRQVAVAALIEHYRDDPQTLLLLHDRAIKDESPTPEQKKYPWQISVHCVRETAINAIAEYWHTEPDTLSLLRYCAENDPMPWLRERAKKLADEIEAEAKKE
jgi:HEAT repeat protein